MKKIDTLIPDLEEVIYGRGGWNASLGTMMGEAIASSANARFSKPQEPRGYLSLSSIGTPLRSRAVPIPPSRIMGRPSPFSRLTTQSESIIFSLNHAGVSMRAASRNNLLRRPASARG